MENVHLPLSSPVSSAPIFGIVQNQLLLGHCFSHVISLHIPFEDDRLGGWKKGIDYLRIDGSVDNGKRGELVESFNKMDDIKAFLISSLAGGIGINLVRVLLRIDAMVFLE